MITLAMEFNVFLIKENSFIKDLNYNVFIMYYGRIKIIVCVKTVLDLSNYSPVKEKTMLVSSDIKFITRDQKQRRNGEACRASPTCFWSSLINLILKDTHMVFYLSCIISRPNGEKTAKQMKIRRSFVRTCCRRVCVMT